MYLYFSLLNFPVFVVSLDEKSLVISCIQYIINLCNLFVKYSVYEVHN